MNFENIRSELEGNNEWKRSLAISKVDKAINEDKKIEEEIFDLFPDLLFDLSDGVDEFNVKGVIIKYLNNQDDENIKREVYEKLETRMEAWKEKEQKENIERKRKLIRDIKRLTSPL